MPVTVPAAPTTRISNPKITIYAIAASGGAAKAITCTKFCRYVEIYECAPDGAAYNGTNFAPQGTNYTVPDDSFTTAHALLPAQVLPFGDQSWNRERGIGSSASNDPAGQAIPATIFCKMTSATASTTQVALKEWS